MSDQQLTERAAKSREYEAARLAKIGRYCRELTVLQILEYHRQQYPFEEDDDDCRDIKSMAYDLTNRDRYYWLSGFLNDFLEQQK